MNNLLYCQSCGSKHEYTLTRPRFCGQCGVPFAGAVVAKTPQKNPPITSKSSIKSEGDEEDADKEVPVLEKLEISIEIPTAEKITFANVKNVASFARDAGRGVMSKEDFAAETDRLFAKDRELSKQE